MDRYDDIIGVEGSSRADIVSFCTLSRINI